MAAGVWSLLDDSGFETACRRAVDQSRAAADRLESRVAELVGFLTGVESRSGEREIPSELAEKDREVTDRVVAELKAAVAHRMAHIDTFNVTLFGRTGVGKSSLMEAFVRGSGSWISPGESDFTVKSRSVRRGSLQITDTPGTQGWGRTVDAAELRARALTALAASDLVILCFDSFNQRVAEFETVAEWIVDYGKPVIAVLNVRNAAWRFPPKANSRRRLSRTVREHVGEITECLAGIGLAGTPIVALSAKNAAFARTRDPYAGPDATGRLARLRAAGSDRRLLDWSNLDALRMLIVAAIRDHAVDLRLAALYRQVSAAVENALKAYAEAEDYLIELAGVSELGVQRALAVLGAPETLAAPDDPGAHEQLAEVMRRLDRLEELRGARIPAPSRGSALRHADQLITANLGPARIAALERAESLVDRSMAERRTVTEKRFAEEVFRAEEVEACVGGIHDDFTAFLRERLGQLAADVRADVGSVTDAAVRVRGRRGQILHWTAVGASVGGIGLTLLGAAVANFWNPLGWSAFAVGTAVVVGGFIMDLLGRFGRRRAAARRERELGQARSSARRAVNEAFDRLQKELADAFAAHARATMVERVNGALAQAIELRERAARRAEGRAALKSLLDGVPAAADPHTALREAMAACERAAGVRATPSDLWLGESWLREDGSVAAPIATASTLWTRDDVSKKMTSALSAPAITGSGRAWLAEHRQALSQDPAGAEIVEHLERLAADALPRVVFCGDYNTGKTSLIARLCRDIGLPVPEGLVVGGRPTTETAGQAEWHGYRLIDTPGFQSRHARHASEACAAAAEAAVVVYVLAPTALAGDFSDVRAVLGGARASRVLLVISRADELGVDPQDSPRAFVAQCVRKGIEVRTALRRTVDWRLSWPQPVALAPAPYDGALTSAPWDGMTEFARTLRALRPHIAEDAVDRSILGAALHRLAALTEEAEAAAAVARPEAERQAQLLREVTAASAEAAALAADRGAALRRIVADFLENLTERVLATRNDDAKVAILKRMSDFSSDKELVQLVHEWSAKTRTKTWSFIRDSSATLSRSLESAPFASDTAAPDAESLNVSALLTRRSSVLGTVAKRSFALLSRMDKLARRVGAGARTMQTLRVAGPVVALLGAGVSTWDLVSDLRAQRRNEHRRTELLNLLHATGRNWADTVCAKEEAMEALAAHRRDLDMIRDEVAADLTQAEQNLAAINKRVELYQTATAAARAAVEGRKQ